MGAAGEEIASRWLTEKGLRILDRNVAVGDGELDLIALDGNHRVAVEVRTVTGTGDPIDAIDSSKRRHVAFLARRLGAARVDLVGVGLRQWGVEIHWVPGGLW